ncbi:hypothetical protein CC1G_14130 [Coprinopsis cinerea okayama7|uniref:Uncharacterized protein n=1 Tax=Coprinopsis cinerea (strain Okayama-7 / 130 / ATCC MYA-4618 / FGSC 9003) TaxID=240176 RepID=D6RLB5_COPC7|nr:hypothetical protein CC1G_14130 [Coprinopsis cinerea okayama7\|eukprot:XP_002911597.1 hypothetical protein CC1G_14130 [Coprinopsis cinerea okayama7\
MGRHAGGIRRPEPLSLASTRHYGGVGPDDDCEEPVRGRLFRRGNVSASEVVQASENCMYMVVRREKIHQAVGRIVFIPSSPPRKQAVR